MTRSKLDLTMKTKRSILLIAVGIGIANALLLYMMELVGVHATAWLWNDLLNTDEQRWLIIPTAVVLGLVLTFALKRLNIKRIQPPEADLMDTIDDAPASASWIGKAAVIGSLSLLAGASLGPEASLMVASASIGALATKKGNLSSQKKVLILASIGALLVAFIASLVLVLIPLLVLLQTAKKQRKGQRPQSVIVILVAAIASYVTILAIDWVTGESGGYGALPTLPAFAFHDFVGAIALGFVSGFISFATLWLIDRFYSVAKKIDTWRTPAASYVVASVFATILGVLYLVGGPTVQFSGSVGTSELIRSGAQYGVLALLAMLITKILATAWSKGTGYWGGLVFPSIYMGVVLGLLAGLLFPDLGGAGVIIGGMSGMVAAALGSPILAAIFLAAIVPFGPLWLVVICAVAGTVLYTKVHTFVRSKTAATLLEAK